MTSKMPEGYISFAELMELSERSKFTVSARLKKAGIKGKRFGRILIYPSRAALYAVIDE